MSKEEPKLPDGLPSVVKIGAFDLPFWPMKAQQGTERGEWGSFSGLEMAIRLQVEDVSNQKLAHTLIHEIMHGIYRFWDVEKDDNEESVVTKMSFGWAAVVRDNPELASWIVKSLAGG